MKKVCIIIKEEIISTLHVTVKLLNYVYIIYLLYLCSCVYMITNMHGGLQLKRVIMARRGCQRELFVKSAENVIRV